MNILFLAQRVPYPPNRGDKISTWRICERFSREHDLTIVAFAHDQADLDAARVLNEEKGIRTIAIPHNERSQKIRSLPLLLTNKPLTLGVFSSKELERQVNELLPKMDLGYAFSSSMGAFLTGKGVPWVMHFAELDSDKWRQYADKHRFPMSVVYRREWKTLRAFESKISHETITNVFCTPLEEDIFQKEIPGCPSTVMRNGVALDHYQPSPDAAEDGHLVFIGVMDYFPNVDGCVWFANEIFPLIRREVPHARFTIVGSKPTAEVLALGSRDAIEVTGFVDDPREYLKKAAVSVAPLRVARGIQNKVLEALAMGLPTVGTTSATQGVEGTPGQDFLVADTAEAFAARVVELLKDPARARALGDRGREFVEGTYDWETCLRPLDDMIDRVRTLKKPVG
ncbi:TIGR03087 family PEP-CTERM/XrtA system glycosyltransferase [Saltatorellus ferox]|uniref:TIGR03087 family PEP-CTERM/XrtA system glycosyltransferase n=1 Tax=Saltatorellus ferox TaxID=2528018 RepID=UPI003AF3928F